MYINISIPISHQFYLGNRYRIILIEHQVLLCLDFAIILKNHSKNLTPITCEYMATCDQENPNIDESHTIKIKSFSCFSIPWNSKISFAGLYNANANKNPNRFDLVWFWFFFMLWIVANAATLCLTIICSYFLFPPAKRVSAFVWKIFNPPSSGVDLKV